MLWRRVAYPALAVADLKLKKQAVALRSLHSAVFPVETPLFTVDAQATSAGATHRPPLYHQTGSNRHIKASYNQKQQIL
ncbi:hypothetical protein [Spirosoma panaciterrae]|uniref:hypothetical protein n=1 Tax=Spirosoma panaciterrae TaxID=496058 RepID=UPI00037805D8|nr:hypothetical protein [Spirosoma panaciterrae]